MMGHSNSPGRDVAFASAMAADGGFQNVQPGAAANALLDVVVFAGGDSPDLQPLSGFEQKCMLRVCNRPMIWFCLAPWIAAGFRAFFIVVNEDYATLRTYLSREFSGVDFYFIFVPLMIGEHASTTCDGVRAYMSFKEQLRAGAVDSGVVGTDSPTGPHRSTTATTKTKTTTSTTATANASSPTGSRPQPLQGERAALPNFRRDALLLSCDTILAGVDVDHFVSSFYSSMASASALFFRPLDPTRTGSTAKEKEKEKEKEKGRKGKAAHPLPGAERKNFTHSYTCAAYEETDVIGAMAAGGGNEVGGAGGTTTTSSSCSSGDLHLAAVDAAAAGTGSNASPTCVVQHRRLHYMYPLDERPELRITMGFAARRPNLTFAADVVDAHAYLVRHWVLDFIAESAGTPDLSVRKYILPLLARSQHSVVNAAENTFLTPDKKIGHAIPPHWMYRQRDGQLSIDTMNAARGPALPEKADSLRVFCTIYNENALTPTKIYRINTRDNYQAVNQEIIAMKCQLLHLLDEPPAPGSGGGHGVAVTAGLGGGGVETRALPLLRAPGAEMLFSNALLANPNASASALAFLLPDNPFTLREKLGSQQLYIVGSFIDSVPPPNTYITRSAIGPNVTIGRGARITDSVILANVDIGAKAVITGSIIGGSAVIDAERSVIGCVVAPRCYVEEDKRDAIVE